MPRSNRQRAKQRQAARRAERRLDPYVEADYDADLDDPEADLVDVDGDTLASERIEDAEESAVAYRSRGKVAAFLASVVAELKRVEWPNRQQVTLLTGVVLGFVLIAGGYLGLLDLIFSKLLQQIL